MILDKKASKIVLEAKFPTYGLTLRTRYRLAEFFEFLIGHLICLQNELVFQSKVVQTSFDFEQL